MPLRFSALLHGALPLLRYSFLRLLHFVALPRQAVASPRYSMHFHCRASHCVTLPLHFIAYRYIALAARFISAPLLRNATPRNALPPPIFALLYFAFATHSYTLPSPVHALLYDAFAALSFALPLPRFSQLIYALPLQFLAYLRYA